MKKNIFLVCCLFAFNYALDAQILKSIQNIKLTDLNNLEIQIPDFEKKTLFVVYLDPDVDGITDELTDAVNKNGFPISKLGALGVVNCKDTWIPNGAIIKKARIMQKKYSKSEILLDKSSTLKNTWNLGDCNNLAVIMVVGQDGKIKFLQKIKSKEEAHIQIPVVIKLLNSELK
jgi:hypothetical protein